MNADSVIKCMIDKELITPEAGEQLINIIGTLPDNSTELLKILVALNINQLP